LFVKEEYVRAETRHQLKTDRFTQATIEAAEATAHWTAEHKSKLIAGIVIAVVVLAALSGGWYYLSQQDDKANVELTKAVRTLQTQVRPAGAPDTPNSPPSFASAQDRATAAKKQLQDVVDRYPHTRTADFARYLLGTTAVELGDKATAERQLKDAASTRNRDLAALAKVALAAFYGNNNRTKEAADLYRQLIDKPTTTVSKVMAQMQLAALYETSQQPLEAKRIYEQIVKENPKSEAESMAQGKLQALK
jgi:predicted negative regulator of RcsB-dependent stress response